MAADPSTLYARLSPIRFTDFTPSRVTRISSNTYLQEHGPLEDLLHGGRVSELELERERSHSAMVVCNERPLKGRYVDIDFVVSYPGGNRSRVDQLQKFASEQYAGRAHSRSDPTANGTVYPLYMRTRGESRRTAIRKKPTPESEVRVDVESKNGAGMVDAPSFVLIDGKAEQPTAKCNGVKPPETKPNASPFKIRVRKRRTAVSPPHSPPPPPPPLVVESTSPTVDLTSLRAELSPPVAPAPPENEGYVALQFHVGSTNPQATDSPIPVGSAVQDSWGERRDIRGSESPKDSNQTLEEVPNIGGYKDFVMYSDSEGSSDAEDVQGFPIPICRSHAHKPLGRWTPSNSPTRPPTWSAPSDQASGSTSPPVFSPLLQDSSSPLHSPQIGKTKPVPPPKRSSFSHSPDTLRVHPTNRVLKTMQSSPELFPDSSRPRSVSFLQCKVGQDYGQYSADYLGSKEIDCYLDCVDVVARQLVESRTVDIIAYVTSEKIRLAPPNNSALLFKSFAIKDLLSVQKCSKNKRIVGLVLWKPKSNPICHVLRCPNHLVSSALHEAVWLQSQSVDDIALHKVSSPQSLDLLSHTPSDVSFSSGTSSESDRTPSPRDTPLSTKDTPFSPRDTPFSPRDTPLSPTELLHKFPAIYIGSAAAGKLHSINDVIQKVLSQNRPSQAMEVEVWLSLAQVRFVDMSDNSEMIYATHDTSRIRAIGVYSQDKRFIGYIIKEEGKPLTGHVLRCNSAALMVSLVSFLRQSCQITFYQRGGSFYDELSTDDSEECEHSEGSTSSSESHGILKRLRSLTVSTRSSTSAMASFVSHAPFLKQQSPARDLPQRRRDLVQSSNVFSPLDFSEDDYARFSVNYVGSAALDLPLTPSSILEAMEAFSEEGVRAGQAAVPKNVIHMQVSSLGITLTDKKHRLFVNRNYPRKQLEGCCVHPKNSKYFAIASKRPGFPSSMKVHVFRQVQESPEQIMDAIKFWLEIDPVPS